MRYRNLLIPTVKEAPSESSTPSHVLLLRGGFIRRVGAGIYNYLPLGLRVLQRVANIVRAEMNRAGAQEILMPGVLPAETFKETGRWETFGDVLLRFKDRKGGDYCLGPTHEEIVTDIARHEIRSYRQMPLNLYQIQSKFRDEPRPRAGLLRGREFLMKDAYSFDVDEKSALLSYEKMREAYKRIFARCGLDFRIVAADSGAMGGSTSAEFQILAQTGEDAFVACDRCDYAANVEVAAVEAAPEIEQTAATHRPMEKVATPGKRTIEEVSALLKVAPADMLKSLVYLAAGKAVMAVVRGDHEVNEIKLARALGVPEVFLAGDAEVERATGAPVGFAGPVGAKIEVVADLSVRAVRNGVTGANERDAHLVGVNVGRDFEPARWADLRSASKGDRCVKCGGTYESYRGIEGGHIFVLGTHYTEKMGASYADESGALRPIVMGCYGIGVSRLVAATVEQHHDADGIRWPVPVAPFEVLVTPLGTEPDLAAATDLIYSGLLAEGIDTLLDDREERPGVKFKDADLLGIPVRVTIGKKALADGKVEMKLRTEKAATPVPVTEAVARVAAWVKEARAR